MTISGKATRLHCFASLAAVFILASPLASAYACSVTSTEGFCGTTGSWYETCGSATCTHSGTILTASCCTEDGGTSTSSLNILYCSHDGEEDCDVENHDGVLAY